MNAGRRECFAKSLRLRVRREFLSVQRSHNRLVTDHFIVYARRSSRPHTRVGITVSRKVGRAHVRNKVKRWVREAFRRNQTEIPGGLDVVMVARKGRAPDNFQQVREELLYASRELASRALRTRRRRK